VKLAVTTPKNQKSLFQSSLSSVSALLSIIKKAQHSLYALNPHSYRGLKM
jgi:histidyl-tRNA synthetase